jgi:hypothetical protein
MDPNSLFSLSDHLEALSKEGDPLEILQQTVDFEYSRAWLVEGLGYGDGAKGGRPPFDPVMMFKTLIPAGATQPFGCADGIHDSGPAELAAFPWIIA